MTRTIPWASLCEDREGTGTFPLFQMHSLDDAREMLKDGMMESQGFEGKPQKMSWNGTIVHLLANIL